MPLVIIWQKSLKKSDIFDGFASPMAKDIRPLSESIKAGHLICSMRRLASRDDPVIFVDTIIGNRKRHDGSSRSVVDAGSPRTRHEPLLKPIKCGLLAIGPSPSCVKARHKYHGT